MRIDPAGQALIKAFESCLKPIGGGSFRTYRCPANVLTIGWGSTKDDAPDLKDGDVWPQRKCDDVFARSLAKYEAAVDRLNAQRIAAGHPPLNQNQYNALGSICYNAGPGSLSGSLGAAVREGRDADVPAALARWNKGGGRVLAGLVRRRKAEGEMWSGDLKAAAKTAETILPGSMPQAVSNVQTKTATIQEKPKSATAAATGIVVAGIAGAASTVSPTIDYTGLWIVLGIAAVAAIVGAGILIRHHLSVKE